MKTLLSHLLIVGQTRALSLSPVFCYELCGNPPSIIEECGGYLREGNKATLVKKIDIKTKQPSQPDVVIVDAQHSLYHIVWARGCTASTVATSMTKILQLFSGIPVQVIFQQYGGDSAEDH
ncbi:hypothetical protein Hamer_G005927 [Homarus americanus]|uniref:Uncharacterized protein n=1 Tax=Homarus americanus TaxID=6706 RepID=A0A8J5JKB3_HOMAM|nr:hypothetical protein Hamer_G005927 [Homarus americanus]